MNKKYMLRTGEMSNVSKFHEVWFYSVTDSLNLTSVRILKTGAGFLLITLNTNFTRIYICYLCQEQVFQMNINNVFFGSSHRDACCLPGVQVQDITERLPGLIQPSGYYPLLIVQAGSDETEKKNVRAFKRALGQVVNRAGAQVMLCSVPLVAESLWWKE